MPMDELLVIEARVATPQLGEFLSGLNRLWPLLRDGGVISRALPVRFAMSVPDVGSTHVFELLEVEDWSPLENVRSTESFQVGWRTMTACCVRNSDSEQPALHKGNMLAPSLVASVECLPPGAPRMGPLSPAIQDFNGLD